MGLSIIIHGGPIEGVDGPYALASAVGWGLLTQWADGLSDATHLHELVNEGTVDDTAALAHELDHALVYHPPENPNVLDTAEGLLDRLHTGHPDESATVVGEDYEGDDLTDNYDPDQPRDSQGKFGSGGIVQKAKDLAAVIGHTEHVVAQYAKDKVGETIARLPDKVQSAVRSSFAFGKVAMKALFVNWTVATKLAERTTLLRGATPEQAKRLAGVLSSLDMKTLEVLKVSALSGLHAAHLPLTVHSIIPLATAGYLAYSTARNPLATVRAAASLVKEGAVALGTKLKDWSNQRSTGAYAPFMIGNALSDAVAMDPAVMALLNGLENAHYDDWYVALLTQSLELTGSLMQAVALAGSVYANNPHDHSVPQDSDEQWVMDQATDVGGSTPEQPVDNVQSLAEEFGLNEESMRVLRQFARGHRERGV